MSKPLVSIITTVYNNELYIEESLRSIFNQTFKDFEFIVFNDCSTDKTWEIIEKTFGEFDGDYTIIDSNRGKNIGCAKGRAEAISVARGKYLAIHDGDDISYQHRLEKEVEFLEAHLDVFCVGSWADSVNSYGGHIKVMDFPKEEHDDFVRDIFEGNNTMLDPTTLFKKAVFDELGGYNFEWRLIPDLNLWVRAIMAGYYFANIQESLVAHRKHGGSVMTRNLRAVIYQHKLMDKVMLSEHKKEVFFRR